MRFSEIPYQRPDMEKEQKSFEALIERLTAAESFEEAKQVFLEKEKLIKALETVATVAHIRHDLDTRDKFYDEEQKFFNRVMPLVEEKEQQWALALLGSPYRKDFEREYGDLMFVNTEIRLKTFSPAIVPKLQRENDLVQEYEKVLASARIPFEGGERTLSQMTPFKTDADDALRLAAWQAEGRWYKEHQDKLDALYDELTHLRDEMGKALGYEGYTTLGYYRMGRNCYTKEDVEKFRLAVRTHLVPVVVELYERQARDMGKAYPMNFADNALEFKDGNPRPRGGPEDILAHGKKFYEELSPETGEFFNSLLDNRMLDVLSTEGKAGGGYCTSLPDYGTPFIFANFNGTKGDVEVITHEAGHAFADWMNRDRIPKEYIWPSMEGCEVHSMSMEFFAWPWAEGFFGKDTEKFLFSHLASALKFIPYGTMVDEFQHRVYEKPEMTPGQRHDVWRELLGLYMPWIKQGADIPFYGEGEGWQRQSHIYAMPFYYIDYCLAQTVSLQFWAKIRQDHKAAWDCYMRYTKLGGSKVFTELLEEAGLESPFGDKCLKEVCRAARMWLDKA